MSENTVPLATEKPGPIRTQEEAQAILHKQWQDANPGATPPGQGA